MITIRKEILEIPHWWEISRPISKLEETMNEFEERQRYIWAKSLEVLPHDVFDEDELYQRREESLIDFFVRFNDNYSHLLNKAYFMLDFYADEFFKDFECNSSEKNDSYQSKKKIREEILCYPDWFKWNCPIEELGETMEEFLLRQEYVHDIVVQEQMISDKPVDFKYFNRQPGESDAKFRKRVRIMHFLDKEDDDAYWGLRKQMLNQPQNHFTNNKDDLPF
jgi:hypothetical protein